MLSVHADQNGGLIATVSTDSSERVEFLLLTNITASEQTQRPAPGATTELTDPKHCASVAACLTATGQHLFAVPAMNDHGTVRGSLEANAFHHLAFSAFFRGHP